MKYEYYDFAGNFPRSKRNFMRENIRQLKQMQGLVQPDPKTPSQLQLASTASKYRGAPAKVSSNASGPKAKSRPDVRRPASLNARAPPKPMYAKARTETDRKTIHRGVQTERPEDVPKLYETGVLKYPSQAPAPQSSDRRTPGKAHEQGDSPTSERVEGLGKNLQKLGIDEKHDYIKANIKNIKQKMKQDEPPNPNLPPSGYQKGAVPKYLKDRREEELKAAEAEGDNYPGLVLLPDEERKEYLRVARENYAGLIKELNTMPVRNDTLKRRKRKMEIEEELKRLDEVIKIFQKPKVFVKADT